MTPSVQIERDLCLIQMAGVELDPGPAHEGCLAACTGAAERGACPGEVSSAVGTLGVACEPIGIEGLFAWPFAGPFWRLEGFDRSLGRRGDLASREGGAERSGTLRIERQDLARDESLSSCDIPRFVDADAAFHDLDLDRAVDSLHREEGSRDAHRVFPGEDEEFPAAQIVGLHDHPSALEDELRPASVGRSDVGLTLGGQRNHAQRTERLRPERQRSGRHRGPSLAGARGLRVGRHRGGAKAAR